MVVDPAGSYVIRKEEDSQESQHPGDGDECVYHNIFVTLISAANHWTFKARIIDPNDLYASPENPTVESDVRFVKSAGTSASDTRFNHVRSLHGHFHFACDESHFAWRRRVAYSKELFGFVDPTLLDPNSIEALHQPKQDGWLKISQASLDLPRVPLTSAPCSRLPVTRRQSVLLETLPSPSSLQTSKAKTSTPSTPAILSCTSQTRSLRSITKSAWRGTTAMTTRSPTSLTSLRSMTQLRQSRMTTSR
jgi:hypothetical protein